MSNTLTADQIFAADDQVIEPLSVPEWGGKIYVRSISAKERGRIVAEAARFRESKGKNVTFMEDFDANFVILAACDDAGSPIFSRDQKAQLLIKNAAVVARIAKRAQELAGMSKEDLEALEKNSETTQSDDSDSD
jgi:hypothetical protein